MQRKVKRVMSNLPPDVQEDLNYIKDTFEYSDSAAIRKSVREYARILRLQDGGCEA